MKYKNRYLLLAGYVIKLSERLIKSKNLFWVLIRSLCLTMKVLETLSDEYIHTVLLVVIINRLLTQKKRAWGSKLTSILKRSSGVHIQQRNECRTNDNCKHLNRNSFHELWSDSFRFLFSISPRGLASAGPG